MFSKFPQIKKPPRHLAKRTRNYIRTYWHVWVRAEADSRSWFQNNILPVWTLLVSLFRFFQTLCGKATGDTSTNETTPLLGADTTTNTKAYNIRGKVPVKPLELRINPPLDSPDHVIAQGTFYYSVDPYCVICRKTFHGSESVVFESRWDHQFIAICPVELKRSKRYIAVPLGMIDDEEEPIQNSINLENGTIMQFDIQIVTWQPHQKPKDSVRQDAYAVHRSCRSLAAMLFPDTHIQKLITQFGRSTKYLARTGCCEDKWNGTLQNMRRHISSLDPTDDVAKLLCRLSECPAEIENEIRDYSAHDLLSTIINFYRTTIPLIQGMSNIGTETRYLWFANYKEMAAEIIQIYDSIYLSSLSLHADISPDRSSLKVTVRGVSGIQVGLGDYGIGVQALRILYVDGTSTCIGAAPETSFMTILGTKVTGIKYVRDNLKITKVELIAERSWYLTDRLASIHELVRPRYKSYMLPRHSMTTGLPFPDWRTNIQTSLRKRNFNTWKRSSYHSLISDPGPGPIVSITIYCLESSVCGIAFEKKQPRASMELLGSRNQSACAIHHEFDYNEGLNNILVSNAALGSEDYPRENRCPSLVITTSFSRNLVCAPISQKSLRQESYVQLQDPQNQIIRGLFTDGSTNPDGSIRNLGATFSPLTEAPTSIPKDAYPKQLLIPTSSLPDKWTNTFISTATLSNVHSLATCRRGERITGLRIRYNSYAHTEILGQFDPSNRSSIESVYEYERDEKLVGVIFRFACKAKVGWGDADCEFVCAVKTICSDKAITARTPVSSEGTSGKQFVVFGEELLKPVAWLFNPTNDCVQFWDGKTQKLDLEASGPRRELMLNPGINLPEQVHDPSFMLWDAYESDDGDDEDS